MTRSKLVTMAVIGLAALIMAGCEENESAPSSRPSPYAAYQPSSGQNLSPGIAPYAHGDPEWPMDAGRSGGGGRR